jgi:hypothetical protein
MARDGYLKLDAYWKAIIIDMRAASASAEVVSIYHSHYLPMSNRIRSGCKSSGSSSSNT